MRKVLLTLNNNSLSGIERFTVLLAKYINKSKFDVTVGVPAEGPLCDILKENNIRYFIFNNKRAGKYNLCGILFLFKKIFSEKYDIIHAQAGIAPCLIGKILGTKLILEHRHGLDFTKDEINSMKVYKVMYERMKKYLVNFTITCCINDKKMLVNKFKFKEDKVIVVYYGIEKLEDEYDSVLNDKFTIGTVGRLTYQKGQEYFIEMARVLSSEGYDFGFHIYGSGEKLPELRNLINKYGLADRVWIKGYTNKVSDIMKTFDIFVMTSRYEGIPFVIYEAMRSALPIITTEVGGINETIENMENGILVQNEDVEAMAESVKLLYNSKELRTKFSQNAERSFEENYVIDKTVKLMESIYENNC